MARVKLKPFRLFGYLIMTTLIVVFMTGVTYGLEYSASKTNEFIGYVGGGGGGDYEIPKPPGGGGPEKPKPPVPPSSFIPPGGPPGANQSFSSSEGSPYFPEISTIDSLTPGSNMGQPEVPGSGMGNMPKTGDEAQAKLWLMVLMCSTIVLRRILFFNKNKENGL